MGHRDTLIDSYCEKAIILTDTSDNEYTGLLKYNSEFNKYVVISFEKVGNKNYFSKSEIRYIRTINEPKEWNIFNKLRNKRSIGLKHLKGGFKND